MREEDPVAAETFTVYEDELPPPDDPEVVERLARRMAALRADQRPGPALASGLVGLVVGIALWAELNHWLGFQMQWLVMAGSAVLFGVLLGYPFRRAGHLVDRHWALLAGGLALVMAVVGDFLGVVRLLADERGVGVFALLSTVDGAFVGEWLAGREPLDWLVAGLATVGAAVAARPSVTEAHHREDVRLEVFEEWLAEDELYADDEDDEDEGAGAGQNQSGSIVR